MFNTTLKGLFVKVYKYISFITRHFRANDCTSRAAALTYTSLLAIVPLMTVSFWILSAFPVFEELSKPVEDFIFANFLPSSGQVVQNYLLNFANQASRLSLFGIIFLIITSLLLMFNIERALNQIWRVRAARRATAKFLLYWAVLSLAPVLMGVSFAVSSYLITLPLWSATVGFLGINQGWLLSLAPFVLTTITFTLLYVVVPNCRVVFWHGLVGAFIAAVLFEIAKDSFGLYFQFFGNYHLIYGAFAAIPLFFLWVYLVWNIVLLGAEISHAFSAYYEHRSSVKLDGFMHALLWLGYLWEAQNEGQGLTREQLIARDKHNFAVTPDEMLAKLLDINLITMTGNEVYMLSRDLSRMSLLDLARLLPWPIPELKDLKIYKMPWAQSLAGVITDIEQLSHERMALSLTSLYAQ